MAISDRKKREKEQRRQSIIDAAEMLFFSKGYDNVSMNDIAQEVELNRATIYLYFENKEALCFAVVLRGVLILNQMVKSNVNTASNSQKIYSLGNAYAMFFQLYPQYVQAYNLFQSGRFDLSNLYDFKSSFFKTAIGDVREIIRLQNEIFDILHSSIKTGKTTGSISSDVDPLQATILIMSTMDSMLNPSPMIEKKLEDMNINQYQNFNLMFIIFINKLLKTK
jgi:AcrR family transcriptional regulator